jgi:hypothetical protein
VENVGSGELGLQPAGDGAGRESSGRVQFHVRAGPSGCAGCGARLGRGAAAGREGPCGPAAGPREQVQQSRRHQLSLFIVLQSWWCGYQSVSATTPLL